MTLRTPVLCLDTNASIDFSVVLDLRDRYDSLSDLFDSVREVWERVHYDEHVKGRVSMLHARHKQLSAADRFLSIAGGHACMCLPKFAELEHRRIVADPHAVPLYPTLVDPKDALEMALEVFRETKFGLGLQDAMILASAAVMGADSLVSNDEDFRRAFNAGAGTLVWKLAGKPLALLDHRGPLQPAATLHSIIAKSLRQHYVGSPRFSRPMHVDRRKDGVWYLVYRHPLLAGETKPVLVPGQHHLSVIDAHSLNVCEVREMYTFDHLLPNGVTCELVTQLTRDNANDVTHGRHLRMPKDDDPGYIDVAIPLADLPEQWKNWTTAKGGRADKKLAPEGTVAFVERPR